MITHISKETLDDMYLTKKLSARTIANRLGVSRHQVRKYLLQYKIPVRKAYEISKNNFCRGVRTPPHPIVDKKS